MILSLVNCVILQFQSPSFQWILLYKLLKLNMTSLLLRQTDTHTLRLHTQSSLNSVTHSSYRHFTLSFYNQTLRNSEHSSAFPQADSFPLHLQAPFCPDETALLTVSRLLLVTKSVGVFCLCPPLHLCVWPCTGLDS